MKLLTDQAELWNQFAECERNEMIITKTGRCLFPLLKFHLQLEPGDQVDDDEHDLLHYSLGIERVDGFKWKFRAGHWYPLPGKEDSRVHWYQPEDQSPAPLRSLLRPESINFAKVKLSNRRDFASATTGGRDNYFYLSSFCHYRPVVLIESSTMRMIFRVDECSFIAVTHYQNDSITHLKKHNNPHAKGFLSPDSSLIISPNNSKSKQRAKPGRKRKIPIEAFDNSWHTDDVIQASLVLETMSRTPRYETTESESQLLPNYPRSQSNNTFLSSNTINSNSKYLSFNHRRQ